MILRGGQDADVVVLPVVRVKGSVYEQMTEDLGSLLQKTFAEPYD
jgi:hypothetical protein